MSMPNSCWASRSRSSRSATSGQMLQEELPHAQGHRHPIGLSSAKRRHQSFSRCAIESKVASQEPAQGEIVSTKTSPGLMRDIRSIVRFGEETGESALFCNRPYIELTVAFVAWYLRELSRVLGTPTSCRL